MPYELAFGQHPKCGISGLPVDPELLAKLATEDELVRVVQQVEAATNKGKPVNKEKPVTVAPSGKRKGKAASKEGQQAAATEQGATEQGAATEHLALDALEAVLAEMDEERAIYDALGAQCSEDTRKLCASILAMPLGIGVDLVFEVSLHHNDADSCRDGVGKKILAAEYHPVVLSRSVC